MFKPIENIENEVVFLKFDIRNENDPSGLPRDSFLIYNKKNDLVGKISLLYGYDKNVRYSGHIQYEIDPEDRGHNYAYYATKAIEKIAKEYVMKYLYIVTEIDNIPSKKTIEKLGGQFQETTDVPEDVWFFNAQLKPISIYRLNID
ncbi:MAG: GNAT family N-acetyltransferase [Lactobacillaceae bacterium]|jgi:tagatose 1,6-diphosphate aldolase|nr:GNAT family N-acetyltransferase [Lactobacillaceae bacterium]